MRTIIGVEGRGRAGGWSGRSKKGMPVGYSPLPSLARGDPGVPAPGAGGNLPRRSFPRGIFDLAVSPLRPQQPLSARPGKEMADELQLPLYPVEAIPRSEKRQVSPQTLPHDADSNIPRMPRWRGILAVAVEQGGEVAVRKDSVAGERGPARRGTPPPYPTGWASGSPGAGGEVVPSRRDHLVAVESG